MLDFKKLKEAISNKLLGKVVKFQRQEADIKRRGRGMMAENKGIDQTTSKKEDRESAKRAHDHLVDT